MSSNSNSAEPPADGVKLTETPPTAIVGILRRLGPGLIVAGSIVGSGELIATTKTGAEAGFWLLWLILIGCVIKVFCQVEFGRYSIVTGNSTMTGLAEVPGPHIPGRGNWLVWYWFLMWFASIGQLGGIVGSVGQALSISLPLTQRGSAYNDYVDLKTKLKISQAELGLIQRRDNVDSELDANRAAQLTASIEQLAAKLEHAIVPGPSYDDRYWATIVAVITAVLLVLGRYGFIQSFSTIMVCGFTLVTILNLALLQANESWAVTSQDLLQGMSFRLPPGSPSAVATALATFGIIGVGASELVTYPYWCLEKGYARFTGPRDDSAAWSDRAHGWMRVMRWDAWCSMVVYTFATLAFYLLGAAILGRTQLNPEKGEMVRTLAVMYEPVFTESASILFLFGAFAVLYSTYFVANASHARVFSDTLGVLGVAAKNSAAIRRRVTILSGFFPLLCVAMYLFFPNPAKLVLISGIMQGIMLPMLAGAALYFRYQRCDRRLMPGPLWDGFLWVSAIGMLTTGLWTVWETVSPWFGK